MIVRKATIKKCRESDIDPKRPRSEQKYCLYTKDGKKLLGRHPTRESAEKQMAAVEIHKHSNLVSRLIRQAIRLMSPR